MVPWADRLWLVGYVAHITGAGLGLYEVNAALQMTKHPASVTGTFANRMIHNESNQAIIGPYAIDPAGNVRVFPEMAKHRLAATVEHLTDRASKVYFLTMEGLLFEADVKTLQARQLFDLVKELDLPAGVRPHFKSAYTEAGRVVVANNTYDERDFKGELAGGRLAEWDGKRWTILEWKPFVEVAGKAWAAGEYGNPIYAAGWDRASAILKVFLKGAWRTYRLPKGGQTFDHAWNRGQDDPLERVGPLGDLRCRPRNLRVRRPRVEAECRRPARVEQVIRALVSTNERRVPDEVPVVAIDQGFRRRSRQQAREVEHAGGEAGRGVAGTRRSGRRLGGPRRGGRRGTRDGGETQGGGHQARGDPHGSCGMSGGHVGS